MSRGVTIDHLIEARDRHIVVLAAVAYDVVGLEAIAAAGAATGRPVIAQVGASAFRHVDRRALVAAAHAVASGASTPVGVHLDHSRDLDEIRWCLDQGYTSVMIDGSHLDLAGNIALTLEAIDVARPYKAWVEAELGHLAGDEDRSTNRRKGAMTDPRDAAAFVDATGIDALAVSIGNVHGRTTQPVTLDLGLLAELADATAVPLVLHGASGVAYETLAACARRGIAKVNLNADLRAAYLGAVAAHRLEDPTLDDLVGALGAARSAITDRLVQISAAFHARDDGGEQP